MFSEPVEEPTDAELAAIEAEWPVIEAELAELDHVIRILVASREPVRADVQAYRRAQRRVLREMRTYLVLRVVPGPEAAPMFLSSNAA